MKTDRPGSHIVVTGRNAPEELIAIADLVTEMKVVKHPFRDRGLKARRELSSNLPAVGRSYGFLFKHETENSGRYSSAD